MEQATVQDLYLAHRDTLWNAAVHLLGCPSAAEDVLHDVFVRLLGISTDRISDPRAYLLGAVIHGVRDRQRAHRNRDVRVDDLQSPPVDPAELSPQLMAALGETVATVAAAVATLPLDQREVVVLHAFEGLTFRAIGELCGTSLNTAASRWRYACGRLRHLLAEQGAER